ncbi:MAG: HAMP domain-containing protein [Pseudomonadota bacterium]
MFKRFATREIINVAVVVTGFTIVCCILLYSFVKSDMKMDSIYYESALADTILKSMKYDMVLSNRDSLRHIVNNLGQQEKVKYVRIFNHSGVISFSSNPAEIGSTVNQESDPCRKCHQGPVPATNLAPMEQASVHVNKDGEKIMSLMTPIYYEASCSTHECHYHEPEKALLGGLDVGLSQKQLEASLARLRLRMIIFCVMILILTVAGVTALLWRSVMKPLRDLVDFAGQCYEGKHEGDPPFGTSEINNIGEILQKLSEGRMPPRNTEVGEDDPSSEEGEED